MLTENEQQELSCIETAIKKIQYHMDKKDQICLFTHQSLLYRLKELQEKASIK